MRAAGRMVFPEGHVGPEIPGKPSLKNWLEYAGIAGALIESMTYFLTGDGQVLEDDITLKVLIDGTAWKTINVGPVKPGEPIKFSDLDVDSEFETKGPVVIQLLENDLISDDNLYTGAFKGSDDLMTLITGDMNSETGMYILTMKKIS